MIKKILLYFTFLLLCFPLFSETYPFEENTYVYEIFYDDFPNPGFTFSFKENTITMEFPEMDQGKQEEGQFISEVKTDNYVISKYKDFTYLTAFGQKYMVLYYEDLVCVLVNTADYTTYFGLKADSEYIRLSKDRKRLREVWIGLDSCRINYSSALREKISEQWITYDGNNEYLWQIYKPWCEGQKGSGIDEWISKRLTYKSNRMLIINSYVDALSPDYYYNNERARNIEIKTSDGIILHTLEDTPQIQSVGLPANTTGDVKLTIKIIYKGRKYKDTCISGYYFCLPVPK